MLSVFPNLLNFALLAPLLLRFGLGILSLIRGYALVRTKDQNISWVEFWRRRSVSEAKIPKVLIFQGVFELAIGAALIFGFLTQIAALAMIFETLVVWQHDIESNKENDATRKFSHIFAILMAVALLFLGAGFLAIDLPL